MTARIPADNPGSSAGIQIRFPASRKNIESLLYDHALSYGKELAREIMAICWNIAVIVCTGFSDMIDEKQAGEAGIREF